MHNSLGQRIRIRCEEGPKDISNTLLCIRLKFYERTGHEIGITIRPQCLHLSIQRYKDVVRRRHRQRLTFPMNAGCVIWHNWPRKLAETTPRNLHIN